MPVHEPFEADNDIPTCAVPSIVGGESSTGTADTETTGAAVTTADGSLIAALVPLVLAAETTTCSVEPTSPATGVYCAVVAFVTATQDAPAASHRRHWYANDVGDPDHAPAVAISARPTCAVPSTTGGAVLAGRSETEDDAAVTTADAELVAELVPPLFEAVTTIRMVEPTSPLSGW